MMDGFMQLVKDMRAAQKEYFTARKAGRHSAQEALLKSFSLERRVDEEIAAAERQDQTNDPDCIRMANGQTLRQGNLFENQ